MPLSVMAMLIPRFCGSENDGTRTSVMQMIMNTIGIKILTFIGRGKFGL